MEVVAEVSGARRKTIMQSTADWVSTHSDNGHVISAGGSGLSATRLNELQKKAQKLIECKQKPRAKTKKEREMTTPTKNY